MKAFNQFIQNIMELASKFCDEGFTSEIAHLRRERERLLRDYWRKSALPAVKGRERQEFFREMDFDTIIVVSESYISHKDYPVFLLGASEISITCGQMVKAEQLLGVIIRRYARTMEKEQLGMVYRRLGDTGFYQNDWRKAQSSYRKSLKIYTELRDAVNAAHVLSSLGASMVERGRLDDGEELLKRAHKIAKLGGTDELLMRIGVNLGNLLHIRGNGEKSLEYYREALSIAHKQKEYGVQARIYYDMAVVAKSDGKHGKAEGWIESCKKFAEKANDHYLKGLSYLAEAELYYSRKNYTAGIAVATTAFKIFSELGDRLSVAEVYKIFGMIHREFRHFDIALSYLNNAKKINEEIHNPLNLGETHCEIAALYHSFGDLDSARDSYSRAIECFHKIRANGKIESARKALAQYPK